jgi:hypothetical protein
MARNPIALADSFQKATRRPDRQFSESYAQPGSTVFRKMRRPNPSGMKQRDRRASMKIISRNRTDYEHGYSASGDTRGSLKYFEAGQSYNNQGYGGNSDALPKQLKFPGSRVYRYRP